MKTIFFILLLLAYSTIAVAQDNGQNSQHKDLAAAPLRDKNFAVLPVKLYQKHLSPVIGGKCPMYPSCSHYAKKAIKKHGALVGWFMTCDRLMRCGRDELDQSRQIRIKQHNLCYDPVSDNDFWLK